MNWGLVQGPEYTAIPPSVIVPSSVVTATAPEAGTTKAYQTSGAPGEAQGGIPPLAALLWYVAETVVPVIKPQVSLWTGRNTAPHGVSDCALTIRGMINKIRNNFFIFYQNVLFTNIK
jgi:hypothetical protein